MSSRFVVRCVLVGAFFFVALAPPRSSHAQDLRSRVVVEMNRVETELRERRWNLNSLEEKNELKRQLEILSTLWDRVILYESEIASFDCSGATLDSAGGPPISTDDSDMVGTLSLSGRAPSEIPLPTKPAPSGLRPQFMFVRQITDTEVQLLAQIVYIDDRIKNESWHLNNLNEKKTLLTERRKALASLRRIRNGRC